MTNPLRQPKPSADQRLFEGKYYFANVNAKLAEGSLGTRVYLTREFLWITNELAIPLGLIQVMQIHEQGWLPKRRDLEIKYINPVSREIEAVFLCKPDPFAIGLYRLAPLELLLARIEEARESVPPGVHLSSFPGLWREATPRLTRCVHFVRRSCSPELRRGLGVTRAMRITGKVIPSGQRHEPATVASLLRKFA